MMSNSVNLFHLHILSLATKLCLLAATNIRSSPLDLCPEQCGDVKIVYPFGVGEGCFLPGFEVICDGSVPYLAISSLQLLEILQREVRIKSDPIVTSTNASNYSCNWANSSIELPEQSPYTFSVTQNRFVAVGCRTWGSIWSSTGVIMTSCVTDCMDGVDDGSCTGNGCCEASMPRSGKVSSMFILHYPDIGSNNSSLGYGFIVERGGYNFTVSDLRDLDKNKNISMRLDWAIGEGFCSQAAETEAYMCGQNSSCVDSERGCGYLCECLPGYDGNPYLNGPPGCQYINECDISKEHPCVPQATCRNKVQGFTCDCPKGSRGDGLRKGTGCKKQLPLIPMILGFVAGTAFVIVSFFFWLSRKKKNLIKLREAYFHNNGGTRLRQHFDDVKGTTATQVKIFSADELKKATKNYSSKQLLSRDGRGRVYKGTLQDGSMVIAIKMRLDESGVDKFVEELITLPKIDHRNIVKFLGCCLETQVPTLVYEFISGGTLYDRLRGSDQIRLSWKHTLQIAVEMADAVSYLHSFPSGSGPILHTHFTSSRVLLHEHTSGPGKPREFQLSKLILLPEHDLVLTTEKGRLGCLDPEYFQRGIKSSKSDVYSFGVLLLELLLCQNPAEHGILRDSGSMVLQFLSFVEGEKLFEAFGRAVTNRGSNPEQLQAMARIARNCLEVRGDQRPTMRSVFNEIASLQR